MTTATPLLTFHDSHVTYNYRVRRPVIIRHVITIQYYNNDIKYIRNDGNAFYK